MSEKLDGREGFSRYLSPLMMDRLERNDLPETHDEGISPADLGYLRSITGPDAKVVPIVPPGPVSSAAE